MDFLTGSQSDAELYSCRVCLKNLPEKLIPLTECFNPGKTKQTIIETILYCTGVLVSIEDPFPKYCCKECFQNLQVSYKFKRICVDSDAALKNDALLREKVDKMQYSKGVVVVNPGIPLTLEEHNLMILNCQADVDPVQEEDLEQNEEIQNNLDDYEQQSERNEANLHNSAPVSAHENGEFHENSCNSVEQNEDNQEVHQFEENLSFPEMVESVVKVKIESGFEIIKSAEFVQSLEVITLSSDSSSSLSKYPSSSDDERTKTNKKHRKMSRDSNEEVFNCPRCEACFYFKKEFVNHLEFKHKMKEDANNNVKSPEVENDKSPRNEPSTSRTTETNKNQRKRSRTPSIDLSSVSAESFDPPSPKQRKNEETKTVYPCKACGKLLSHQSSLSLHKKKFHTETTIRCKKCKNYYINSKTFDRHKCKME